MASIEQFGNLMNRIALAPSVPHQRFLGLGVINPRSLLHLQHPRCCFDRLNPPQYVSIRYSERLAEAGIELSVGSRGDSYDNALAVTINGLYTAELIHRRTWKTPESVELATLDWMDWFNHHRLMEFLGYIPPAEAEANYYRQLETSAAEPVNLNQPASTIPGAVQIDRILSNDG